MTLVKGRIRSCTFNGRVERFFKTLKLWQRVTLFAWNAEWIQRRLEVFRGWYNAERPMEVLGGRTPEEGWEGKWLPEPIPFRTKDPVEPIFEAIRRPFRGDPRLPVLEIRFARRLKRPA